MKPPWGARVVPVSSNAALNGSNVIDGPGRLMGWSLDDGSGANTSEVDNSAAAPGAGVTIASLSLPNGVYQVTWFLEISGTPGAGDTDNAALFINATQIGQSANAGAVGTYGPFTAQANVVFGPLTLAVKAVGAATAGTTYRVMLQATGISNSKCTIRDGGMNIAFPAINAQSDNTQWLGETGVRFETSLSVQTVQGTISGVLWILLSDHVRELLDE